ncbi:LysR family transcriptional regulator [Paracidovorax citrulli]
MAHGGHSALSETARDTALPAGLSERRLRYFYAAVTCGSIRAAADKLDVEPSVISRQIQQLEGELGATLLERRGRGVNPTEAAQLVLDHYRERLAGEETLLARLRELQGLERGTIHIVAGEGFTDELINAVLNQFCQRYPGIDVTLELMNVNEVVRAVAEDRAHVGLAYAPPPGAGLRVLASRRQPVCAVVRPNHPLALRRGPLTIADLLDCPVGLMTGGFGLRQLIQMVEFSAKVRFRPGLISNSIAALKHYASTGLGASFLPELVVVRESAAGQLVALPIRNRILEAADAQLVVRDKRPLSAAVKRLLDNLRAMTVVRAPSGPQ